MLIFGAFVQVDKNVYPTLDRPLNADGFIMLQYANTRSFDPGRDYLFPIPLLQIARNGNLIQNPKWGNEQ